MNLQTASAAAPPFNRLRAFWLLVKRELWEHRSLRWLPAVLLALVLLGTLATLVLPSRLNHVIQQELGEPLRLGGLHHGGTQLSIELGEVSVENLLYMGSQIPPEVRRIGLFLALFGLAKALIFPFGFVIIFYFGQALYKENRNRSMLFWKSMPVPDWQFVAAKLVTGLPLILGLMFITVVAAQLLLLLVVSVPALFYGVNPWSLFWAPAPLAQVWGLLLKQLVHDLLWFLPGATLLLAINAWAPLRRSLLALGGLAAIVLDRLLLSGDLVWPWMTRHLVPPGIEQRGPLFAEMARWADSLREMQASGAVFSSPSRIAAAGTGPELLAGLLLAVLLFIAASHLLRWREER
jgi:hypothetical protein